MKTQFKSYLKILKKTLHSKVKNFFGCKCQLIRVEDDAGGATVYCTCTHSLNPATLSIEKNNSIFYVLHDKNGIHVVDGSKGFACTLIVSSGIWYNAVTKYQIGKNTYIVYERV